MGYNSSGSTAAIAPVATTPAPMIPAITFPATPSPPAVAPTFPAVTAAVVAVPAAVAAEVALETPRTTAETASAVGCAAEELWIHRNNPRMAMGPRLCRRMLFFFS